MAVTILTIADVYTYTETSPLLVLHLGCFEMFTTPFCLIVDAGNLVLFHGDLSFCLMALWINKFVVSVVNLTITKQSACTTVIS